MEYILFGAGGHAKVVLDILRAKGERVIGFLDNNTQVEEWNHIKVLGGMDQISEIMERYSNTSFIVTIGDNYIRKKIVESLGQKGLKFGTAIHPSAVIGSNVLIGEGTVIMPNVVINADTVIGEHVIVNTSASIDHDCLVHEFVHISPGVNMAGGGVVGSFSHIGIGASLIPRVKVGDDTIVGAASCVIRDLPDRVVAVGSPAKVIKKL